MSRLIILTDSVPPALYSENHDQHKGGCHWRGLCGPGGGGRVSYTTPVQSALQPACEAGVIIIPIFQVRKLLLKEVK